jgi:hypothetical protein
MADDQPVGDGAQDLEELPELDEPRKLAHELMNTLFATDMLLERALEHEELGTDPMDDVRRAREGVRESLDVIKRRLEP